MEIKAKVKYIRISPKKVRLVVDIIRGMRVEEAQEQLKFITKAASKPISKLLNSSIANAINNFQLKRDNLYIKKIMVDEGSTLKRWKPRAFGRAAPIRKRSSYINIVLDEIVPTKEKKASGPEGLSSSGGRPGGKEIVSQKLSVEDKDPKDIKEISSKPKPTPDRREEVKKAPIFKEEKKTDADKSFDKYRITKRKEPETFKKEVKKGRGFFKKIFRRKSV